MILVICHGNINRSPLCAAVLRDHGLNNVQSAGFVNPGRRAAKKMREVAEQHGLRLEHHRSQLVTREMLHAAQMIVYMDRGNYRRLRDILNGSMASCTVECLGKWHNPPLERIKDPAFMKRDSEELHEVVDQIVSASENLAQELIV